MSDTGDRQSVTGVHRIPSARMRLAEQAERIADFLERRLVSSIPPPPTEEDLANADTLDIEPDPEPSRPSMH